MKEKFLKLQSLAGYNYGINFNSVNAGQLQYTIFCSFSPFEPHPVN